MALRTPDQETEDPLSDEEFQKIQDRAAFDDIVNANYTPDEQADLSAAARGEQSSSKTNTRPVPSRKNSVYDADDTNPVIRPNLGHPDAQTFEGGGRASARDNLRGLTGRARKYDDEKSFDSSGLKEKEGAAASGALGKVGKAEGLIGKGLNTADKFLPPQARIANIARRVFTKKKSAAGLGAGVAVGGLIFGFGIIQGPLALAHLSDILKRPLKAQEEATESRFHGLLRYAKTGNVGETRLTYLASKSNAKTQARMKAIGIEFVGDSVTGDARIANIDSSKYPGLEGKKNIDAAQFLSEKYGIPPDDIFVDPKADGRGGNIVVDVRDEKIFKPMVKDAVSYAWSGKKFGKLITAMKVRPVLRFFGSFNWLHPIKKAQIKSQQAAVDYVRARNAERVKKSPQALARASKVKAKLKPYSGVAGAAGVVQLGVCVAKDVAHEVPLLNYENVVEVSEKSAVDGISLGDQPKTGEDFHISQLGAIKKGFVDKEGRSLWQSMPLQILAGNKDNGGVDMDPDIKQAYSPDSSAANIEKGLNDAGGEALCSTGGIIAGVGLGLVAIVLAAPSGGASIAAYAGTVGVGLAATAVAVTAITTYLPKILADEPLVTDLHSGPLGGSIDAFGAREFANDTYRKSGGVELSAVASASMEKDRAERERKEFESKSFAARMFDVHDYRSAVSRAAIDSPGINPSQITTNVASAFMLDSGWTSGIVSSITPKAYAADSGRYDWGFPEYGFSQEELDNPLFEDPYDNADKAAKILDGDPDKYKERARACFGVELTDGAHGWEVKVAEVTDNDPDKQVIPSTAKYQEANCGDSSNNWLRVRFFIFDSRTMDAYACYDDDDEACIQAGIGQPGTSAAPDSGDDTSDPADTGDAKELARQILENSNITYPYVDSKGKTARDVLVSIRDTGMAFTNSDDPLAVQNREVAVNPKMLQAILEYGKDHKLGVNPITNADHSSTSNHYKGEAVDFDCSIPLDRSAWETIALKYGGKNNGEVCPGNEHWHYDFPK